MEFTLEQLKEVSLKSENESVAAKEEDAVQAVESPLQKLSDDQAYVEKLTKAVKQLTLRIHSTNCTMDEAYDFFACHLLSQLIDTETQLMSLSKTDVEAICQLKKEKKERAEDLAELEHTFAKFQAGRENIQKKYTLKQLKEVFLKSENESDAAKEEDAVQAPKELLAVESPLQNLRDDQADVEMRTAAVKQRTLRTRSTADESCLRLTELEVQLWEELMDNINLMELRTQLIEKFKSTVAKFQSEKKNIEKEIAEIGLLLKNNAEQDQAERKMNILFAAYLFTALIFSFGVYLYQNNFFW